jgi:hypothetical protein
MRAVASGSVPTMKTADAIPCGTPIVLGVAASRQVQLLSPCATWRGEMGGAELPASQTTPNEAEPVAVGHLVGIGAYHLEGKHHGHDREHAPSCCEHVGRGGPSPVRPRRVHFLFKGSALMPTDGTEVVEHTWRRTYRRAPSTRPPGGVVMKPGGDRIGRGGGMRRCMG